MTVSVNVMLSSLMTVPGPSLAWLTQLAPAQPVLSQVAGVFTAGGIAAAGAALVTVPIAIHFLSRLRRRRHAFGAMRFLAQALQKQRRRMQVEQWLLLIMRCLIVFLLGLALAGPLVSGLGGWAGAPGSPRLIAVVLDDSLSTRAGDRFTELTEALAELVAGMRPDDHLGVWLAGRPGAAWWAPGPVDSISLRMALDDLSPGLARSELSRSFERIASELEAQASRYDRVHLVLLSDFARDSLDPAAATPEALSRLAERGVVHVARPAVSASNVVVSALAPRRALVAAPPGRAAPVAVQASVTRYGESGAAREAGLTLRLWDRNPDGASDASPVAQREARLRWAPGQTDASISVDLIVPADRSPAEGGAYLIEAVVDADDDAIQADNRALARVELRPTVDVAVVTQAGDDASLTSGRLSPAAWVRLALSPDDGPEGHGSARASPIQTQIWRADAITRGALATVDAVVLLTPDRLAADQRGALSEWVNQGGVLWVFPPADADDAAWTGPVAEALGLDWAADLEPVDLTAPDLSENAGENAGESINGDADGSIPDASDRPVDAAAARLAIAPAPPEPLHLLAGDWEPLLRTVRVSRRLTLGQPADPDRVWLGAADGAPLLRVDPVGRGAVLLSAIAVDPAWSNLPAKPLWVPLLHESLLTLISARVDQAVAFIGDQPTLPAAWENVSSLLTPSRARSIALSRDGGPLRPAEPLSEPGWHRAQPSGPAGLIVRIDPVAGDARTWTSSQIEAWLGGIDPWRWLEPGAARAALVENDARTPLGWLLLAAVLALAMLETAAARFFSHATVSRAGASSRPISRGAAP